LGHGQRGKAKKKSRFAIASSGMMNAKQDREGGRRSRIIYHKRWEERKKRKAITQFSHFEFVYLEGGVLFGKKGREGILPFSGGGEKRACFISGLPHSQ